MYRRHRRQQRIAPLRGDRSRTLSHALARSRSSRCRAWPKAGASAAGNGRSADALPKRHVGGVARRSTGGGARPRGGQEAPVGRVEWDLSYISRISHRRPISRKGELVPLVFALDPCDFAYRFGESSAGQIRSPGRQSAVPRDRLSNCPVDRPPSTSPPRGKSRCRPAKPTREPCPLCVRRRTFSRDHGGPTVSRQRRLQQHPR